MKKKFIDKEKTININYISEIEEYEANNFAMQLLMPDDLIVEEGLKLANKLKEQKEVIDLNEFIFEMAKIFRVPKNIMRIRLKKLKIID